MNALALDLAKLDSAEAFLDYFDLAYDPRTLDVNRLHILKRFSQYLAGAGGIDAFEPALARTRCRELLAASYQDFVASSGVEQKVFRVFQRACGEQRVAATDIARTRNRPGGLRNE